MNYEETIAYLYRQMPEYQRIGHLAYKEGLDNSQQLDEIFGHPHRRYKTIHVGAPTVRAPRHTCWQPFYRKQDIRWDYIPHPIW